MAAKLSLDRFQLLWYLEGAARGSHLRWDIYPIFVNDVFPQLNENERECIYTYAKRDLSSVFHGKYADDTATLYFLQMLARFNPANQYRVTLKKGREKKHIVENAYHWDGKYYVGWQNYCAPEYIKEVEQKPYKKCVNRFCRARNICLRNLTHKVGDVLLDGISGNDDWACDKCDLLIVGDEVFDPISEMVMTNEKKE